MQLPARVLLLLSYAENVCVCVHEVLPTSEQVNLAAPVKTATAAESRV